MPIYKPNPDRRVIALKVVDMIIAKDAAGKIIPDGITLILEDGSKYLPTTEQCARICPQEGDYVVCGEDNYQYLNPAKAFEAHWVLDLDAERQNVNLSNN